MKPLFNFIIIILLAVSLCSCAGDDTPAAITPAAEPTISGPAFFVGNSETTGNTLWITDGTADGTRVVKDINPARTDDFFGELGASSGGVFFTYRDVSAPSLWFSDGSEAGTQKLADLVFDSQQFAVVNDILYFSSYESTSGEELWRSDGTPEGTYLLKDIHSASSYPSDLLAANGLLFFAAMDLSGAMKPWVSDGTGAGTCMLADIWILGKFTQAGNKVFFLGYEPTSGIELWVSDGTVAGTHIVKDINPSTASSNPSMLTSFKGWLYFSATDTTHGTIIWKTNGTEAGTVPTNDVFAVGSGTLTLRVATDTALFFTLANSTDGSIELWATDGTTAGSRLLRTLYPGENTMLYPDKIFVCDDKFYFVASTAAPRFDIWKSDGTVDGTAVVTDLLGAKYDIHPSIPTGYGVGVTFLRFIEAEGALYLGFGGVGTETITHLWATDGTEAGTYLLKDIYAESLP